MDTRKGMTIAAACMLVLCSAGFARPAAANAAKDAREPASSMALVVFEGVPGSEALLRGDYEAGLQQSLEATERSPGRHAFEKDVPAGKEAYEDVLDYAVVSHDHLGDLVLEALERFAKLPALGLNVGFVLSHRCAFLAGKRSPPSP